MHIAILEDDPEQAKDLTDLLALAGHTVTRYADGHQILRALLKETFDLFVLDWQVPGPNGLEVLTHIRERAKLKTPVVFLTAQDQEMHVANALNAGADDYCVKPVRRVEFMARVAAIQRRFAPIGKTEDSGEFVPGYVFERSRRTVSFDGQQVSLTEKEYELARLLFSNLDRPIARNRIMQEVWGREEDALSRTLDVHISWLRRKLDLGANARRMRLVVVHGFGYRLIEVGETS